MRTMSCFELDGKIFRFVHGLTSGWRIFSANDRKVQGEN